MQDKYIYQKENSASVIFMGDSTNEKHDIKNSPYWKNLYGKHVKHCRFLMRQDALFFCFQK